MIYKINIHNHKFSIIKLNKTIFIILCYLNLFIRERDVDMTVLQRFSYLEPEIQSVEDKHNITQVFILNDHNYARSRFPTM